MNIEKKDDSTDVSGVIDVLVAVDRQFAIDAFDAANTPDNQNDHKSEKYLHKAAQQIEEGDKDRDKGKFDKAIDYYKKAWQYASKSNV